MAAVVLHTPQTITHDAVVIDKAQDFNVSEQGAGGQSMGDDDTYASATFLQGVGCGVSATSTDVAPGIAVGDEASTLTCAFTVANRTTGASVTVLNAMYLGGATGVSRGGPNCSHSWLPRSADGTTSPISWTNAS